MMRVLSLVPALFAARGVCFCVGVFVNASLELLSLERVLQRQAQANERARGSREEGVAKAGVDGSGSIKRRRFFRDHD